MKLFAVLLLRLFVLGGSAMSVMPEELLRAADVSWACLGDGEKVFPAFLEKLSGGDSPGDSAGRRLYERRNF